MGTVTMADPGWAVSWVFQVRPLRGFSLEPVRCGLSAQMGRLSFDAVIPLRSRSSSMWIWVLSPVNLTSVPPCLPSGWRGRSWQVRCRRALASLAPALTGRS